MQNRAARMMVLTLHRPETKPCNLITVIRHRRHDALGPWATKPSKVWTSENLGNGLRLHSLDAPLNRCEVLVQGIRNAGTLAIKDEQIDYALEPIPRLHRLFRDERGHADAPMTSPFSQHSAGIVEYWSLADEPRRLWAETTRFEPRSDTSPAPPSGRSAGPPLGPGWKHHDRGRRRRGRLRSLGGT